MEARKQPRDARRDLRHQLVKRPSHRGEVLVPQLGGGRRHVFRDGMRSALRGHVLFRTSGLSAATSCRTIGCAALAIAYQVARVNSAAYSFVQLVRKGAAFGAVIVGASFSATAYGFVADDFG